MTLQFIRFENSDQNKRRTFVAKDLRVAYAVLKRTQAFKGLPLEKEKEIMQWINQDNLKNEETLLRYGLTPTLVMYKIPLNDLLSKALPPKHVFVGEIEKEEDSVAFAVATSEECLKLVEEASLSLPRPLTSTLLLQHLADKTNNATYVEYVGSSGICRITRCPFFTV